MQTHWQLQLTLSSKFIKKSRFDHGSSSIHLFSSAAQENKNVFRLQKEGKIQGKDT